MSHRISFNTTFKEKDFSKYDWESLKNNSPKGKLRDLCDKLLKYIQHHIESHTFSSHSNLYELLNDLFNAYLSWNECTINLYQILNYVNTKNNTKINTENTANDNDSDNEDDDDNDIDIDVDNNNNNKNTNKSLLPQQCQLLILDILSLHWNRVKSLKHKTNKNNNTNNKKNDKILKAPEILKYEDLVRELLPLIDPTLLKTKLNAECCHSLDIFKGLKLPRTKDIDPISTLDRRRKTKMYYVQNKFNLLIEETEGYSKLVTELAEHLQSNQYKKSLYSYYNHNYIANGYGHGMEIDEDDDIKMMNGYSSINTNDTNTNTNTNTNNHNNNNNNNKSEDDSDENGKNSQHLQLENKIFELIGQFKLDPNRYAIKYKFHKIPTMAILSNLPPPHYTSCQHLLLLHTLIFIFKIHIHTHSHLIP